MGERRVRHRLGKHLVDGLELRSAPPIEGVWIGTFGLRWWQHVESEHTAVLSPGDRKARQTTIGSTV